jgi:hypothetical protein
VQTTVTDQGSPPATTAPPASVPAAGDDDGDPTTVTLSPGAPYTVPAGQAFLVDQAIVRNPFGDEGTATLRLGNVAPFPLELVNLQDGLDWNLPFTTPVKLPAGEQVSLDVECVTIGQLGGTSCTTQAIVIGRLVAA